MSYRCPLGKIQSEPMDTEKIKRDGWVDQGILVVDVADPRLDFFQRETVKQIGNQLFGKGEK